MPRTARLCAALSLILSLTASPLVAQNLLVNGDFSAGLTGFSSGYLYAAPAENALTGNGRFTVAPGTKSPDDLNPRFASYFDHTTGDANGAFLIINGRRSGPVTDLAWSAIILEIQPHTDYRFSYWISSAFPPARQFIRGLVNNDPVTGGFLPGATGEWMQVSGKWNSGDWRAARLDIVTFASLPDQPGGAFGLDDLRFVAVAAPEPSSLRFAFFALLVVALVSRLAGLANHRKGRRCARAGHLKSRSVTPTVFTVPATLFNPASPLRPVERRVS